MYHKIFAALSFSLLLCSCAAKKEQVTITPVTTEVSGDLSDYLEIESKSVQVVPSSQYWGGLEAKVKLKVIKTYPEMKDIKGIDHISLTLLGDDESPTPELDELKFDGFTSFDGVKNLQSLLTKGVGEYTASFYMRAPSAMINKDFKEILAAKEPQLKKFTISSVVWDKATETASNGSFKSNIAEEAESSDYDAMLDSYEEYVDDYVKVIESTQKGDVADAWSNTADLVSSSEDLSRKLEAVRDKLTTQQVAKMMKIQAKMIKAVERSNQ